jgi:hypothetical protein
MGKRTATMGSGEQRRDGECPGIPGFRGAKGRENHRGNGLAAGTGNRQMCSAGSATWAGWVARWVRRVVIASAPLEDCTTTH